jgi:hypothetical protein
MFLIIFSTYPHPLPPPVVRLTPKAFQLERPWVELVPTLMIDDAETKMRTDAAVLFELKTLVQFFHTLQICELIYVAVYLATGL